ncbi:MAG: hypothetical protein II627_03770, partial [Lachnospiraceae bacterium]|nr:hypothetical protein [Lachnospiraceae bacterium]
MTESKRNTLNKKGGKEGGRMGSNSGKLSGNKTGNQAGRHAADPRVLICRIVKAVLEDGAFSHEEIGSVLKQYPDMDPRNRGMIEYCSRAVLEHLYRIDAYLDLCSSKPVSKLKPWIRTILRVSMAQLLYMDRIPARAVLNEAGKLTGQFGLSGLRGYVNGVLRGFLRLQDQNSQRDDPESKAMQVFAKKFPGQEDPVCRLSYRYSMPGWILKRYLEDFGPEKTEGILEAYHKPVKTTCARNKAAVSLEELKAALEKENVRTEPLPYGLDGVCLTETADLTALKAFQEGAFFIQDVSSMIQGLVVNGGLGPQASRNGVIVQTDSNGTIAPAESNGTIAQADPDQVLILDVCGAPGGKSFRAASDMLERGLRGHVICRDLSQEKADRILENVRRLKLDSVQVQVWDALKEDPALKGMADLVIADLPCSGLGIIGRKPEIRYRVSEDDIRELAALQRQILKVCAAYVKPGGRLVYSTCTLSREEDEDNYRYLTEELPF